MSLTLGAVTHLDGFHALVVDGEILLLLAREDDGGVVLVAAQLIVVQVAQHVENAHHVIGLRLGAQVDAGRPALAVAGAVGLGVAVIVRELDQVAGIVVLLVGQFLILQRPELAVHGALEGVAHGIHLVGPRACLAGELGIVAVLGLAGAQRRIGGMLPDHAPVVHDLIIQGLVAEVPCPQLLRQHEGHHKRHHCQYTFHRYSIGYWFS